MDMLAFVHAAVAYENLDPEPKLRAFKKIELKASPSFMTGLVTLGVVASTMAHTNRVQATVSYGSIGSDVKKLQTALGAIPVDGIFGSQTLARLKSYQNNHGLAVDGIAGPATLLSLGLSSSLQNAHTQLEQYGKLKLINDTPYMAIITLHEPGKEQAFKYAYIPSCSERTLLNTYSSSWNVSFNGQEKHSIAKFFHGKTFQVRTQKLNNFKEIQTCEYDLQILTEINSLSDSTLLKEVIKIPVRFALLYDQIMAQSLRIISDFKLPNYLNDIKDMKPVLNNAFDRNIADKNITNASLANMFSDILENKKLAQLMVDRTQVYDNITENQMRYVENWVAALRNKYKVMKENGQESTFNSKYLQEQAKKLNLDCKKFWGVPLLKEDLSEIFATLILSFNESIQKGQKISNILNKETENNSQQLPENILAELPKDKAVGKTMELECIPVAQQ